MQIFSYTVQLVQSFFENEYVIAVASIITLVIMFVIPAMIITSILNFIKVMVRSVSKKQLEQMKKIHKERKF
jgi:large-conductance mechanosensitive channel